MRYGRLLGSALKDGEKDMCVRGKGKAENTGEQIRRFICSEKQRIDPRSQPKPRI